MFNLPHNVLTDVMLWFGDGHTHKDPGYKSGDRKTIWNQLTLMDQAGITGPRMTWAGLANPYVHAAAQEMAFQCWQRGMKFCLLIDPNISKKSPGSGLEDDIIVSLKDAGTQAMLSSPAYIQQKYVCDFSTGADYSKIAPSFPGVTFLMKHSGFTWIEKAGKDGKLTAAQNSLQTMTRDSANQSMKIAGLCAAFDNGGFLKSDGSRDYGLDVWDGATGVKATVIEPLTGNFFRSLVLIAPDWTDFFSLISWNDIDEGHGIWETFFSIEFGTPLAG